MFATCGDIHEGQFLTSHWDDAYFNQMVQVRRPQRDAAILHFTNDAASRLAGPYGAGDADTDLRQVRYTQPVPFQYAAYFLEPRTPRECVMDLLPIVEADGNIATKDELVAAQTRVKAYQEELLDFRECLLEVENSLDVNMEGYEEQKASLAARANSSIDLENTVADEFNEAIRIYRSR